MFCFSLCARHIPFTFIHRMVLHRWINCHKSISLYILQQPWPSLSTLTKFIPFQLQSANLDFFIDIHAHSTLMNGFMYGNIFDDEGRARKQAVFPSLMSEIARDFSLPQTNFNRDSIKAGTGRRYVILSKFFTVYLLGFMSFYTTIVSATIW